MTEHRNLSGCQVFKGDALPNDWNCVPLKERVEFAYGRALHNEDRKPGVFDVYGSNGKVGEHVHYLVDAPGILVGRKGSVGAVHYADRPFWPIDTVYFVRSISDDNFRFLFHLLNYLPLSILNAATGVPGLSRRDAYALRGVFPHPVEQEAIARILDAVDRAIERTQEAVEKARTLYTSLITDTIERIGGAQKRLGDYITNIRYGTSQAANERDWGYPTLRIPNVVADDITLDDLTYVDVKPAEVARLKLKDGDLLLVRTNGNPSYVGRSAVFKVPDQRIWLFASYLIRVRLDDRLIPDYINIYLGMERGRRELLRRVTTSAGNHNINTNSIRLTKLPVPESKDQQKEIIEIAGKSRAYINGVYSKLHVLEQLKKALMHDLLTGKVRVNNLNLNSSSPEGS